MAENSETKEKDIIKYILACKEEAAQAKTDRMDLNRDNFLMYQLKHDFSHKADGQSTEVLPKLRMSVEQTKSFFQQALADIGEWFDVVRKEDIPEDALPITPAELKTMIAYQQKKSDFYTHIGNTVQSGVLGALMVTKTTGCMVSKPKFTVRTEGKGKSFKKHVEKIEDKTWRLKNCIIRQEDFYPDPTGANLYDIEEMFLDLHTIKQLSEGEYAIYDKEAVNSLTTSLTEDTISQQRKNDETGQNSTNSGHRPKVRILEFWGTVIDESGEILYENVLITLANETHIIRGPISNPNWSQERSIHKAAIIEVANSVWPVAMADAGTKLNRTIIELFNLVLDAAFKKVHAISQIRASELVDPSQVSEGIRAGTKLVVKSSLPVGGKVMERLEETEVPSDSLNVLNILQQEFNAAMLTNDLRQGVFAPRAVKATEVVEASQTITSIFQGISKNIETKLIEPTLEAQAYLIAQNWDLISKDEKIALYGMDRGTELSQLDPQDVFVSVVNGFKFQVFGITRTLSKAQDFRKLTTLLQSIGSSDILIEEFIKKYDFGKLLGEIMTSLDIDKAKIKQDMPQEGAQTPQLPGQPNQDFAGTAPPPQAGMADIFGNAGIPQTQFPGNGM